MDTLTRSIEELCALNAKCFGPADKYSNPRYVRRLHTSGRITLLHLYGGGGDIVAYYILRIRKASVHGDRLGVTKSHRRRGLGAELVQRAVSVARGRGVPFKTYAHRDNIQSCNVHIKSGVMIERTDADYIYFRSKGAR